jgi:hypothetical protein
MVSRFRKTIESIVPFEMITARSITARLDGDTVAALDRIKGAAQAALVYPEIRAHVPPGASR